MKTVSILAQNVVRGFSILTILVVSVSARDAYAADLDGDGIADTVGYNCTSAACTLNISNSSDGSRYEFDVPTEEYKNDFAPKGASGIDPNTGAVSMALANGIVFRTLPKAPSALQMERSIQALTGSNFPNIAQNDINGYMNYFCVNLQLPNFNQIIGQIQALEAQLNALVRILEALKDPSKLFDVNMGNLASCIPNISAGVNFPTADQFAGCFGSLANLEGTFKQIGQCVANVANSAGYNVNIPSGSGMQQCIMNNLPSGSVNLPNVDPLALINQAMGIINSLRNLIYTLKLSYPAELGDALNWMKNYCRFFQTNTTGIQSLSSSSPSKAKFSLKPRSSKSKKDLKFTINGMTVASCKELGRGKFSCKAASK